MAMSGSSYTAFGGYYRLQLEWEVTSQNEGANASTINARLYLISLNSAAPIYSTTTKTFSITIDGVTTSSTGTVALNGNQKKLLHTHVRTVSHNSNGTKTSAISGNAELGVTINGTYFGSRSVSLSAVLNSIDVTPPTPATSTVSSTVSWRAGENLAVSISRASTAVTHTVRLYMSGNLIATKTGVGTSTTFDLSSTTIRNTIFNLMSDGTSRNASVQVDSIYKGSKIGSTHTKDGIVLAGLVSEPELSPGGISVGETVRITFNAKNSAFSHAIEVYSQGIYITSINVAAGVTYFDFNSSTYANALHNALGSVSLGILEFRVKTKHGTNVIRGEEVVKRMFLQANVQETAPTFTGGFTVTEGNSAVTSMFNVANTFVSGISHITVTIPQSNLAVAGAGATISRYIISAGNKAVSVDHPSSGGISATLTNVVGTGTRDVSVTAIDSRGAEVTQYKTVTFLPYISPTARVAANRVGSFETETVVTFTGNHAPVTLSGTARNSKVTHRYRVKSGSSAYGAYVNLPLASSSNEVTLQLDNTMSHIIQYQVADKVNTVTVTHAVSAGKPIVFVDSERSSVGVNKFPTRSNAFEVDGPAYVNGALDVEGDVDVEGQLVFTAGTDSKITNDVAGLRLYGNSSSGYMEIFGSSTLRLSVKTNRPRFTFDSPIDAPTFHGDLVPTTNKLPNGYNLVTQRTNTTHSDPVMIQETTVTVSVDSGSGSTNISFPTAFNSTPDWVLAVAVDANANTANVAVYSPTSTGCQIHVRRVDDYTLPYTVKVRVVACGRRS